MFIDTCQRSHPLSEAGCPPSRRAMYSVKLTASKERCPPDGGRRPVVSGSINIALLTEGEHVTESEVFYALRESEVGA
jgi:hypothetical protein